MNSAVLERAADRDNRIAVDGLTRAFGDVVAVHPLQATIGPGDITGLLGPNGSGKSTLLRMLVGLVRPDDGRATIAGTPLAGDGAAIRRRVTYLPGELGVYGELTGHEHLNWLARGRRRGTKARAIALAEELGLPLRKRVHGYSHGMKRQLLLAGALAPDVPVRILDEPTEGLDPSKRARVLELLKRDVAAHGTTILFSSHHLGEVEEGCDRILFLQKGRLVDEDEARRVEEHARRMLKIAWSRADDVPDEARIASVLEEIGITESRVDGAGATLVLPGEDPRAALRALLERPDLPAPTSLSYGTLSLQELYRVLYGEEGI